MKHDIMGELKLNEDREEYETKKTLTFGPKEVEITITLSETFGNGGVEDGHIKAYEALMKNWDKIISDVLNAIIEYQNKIWESTVHTNSFKKFETTQDVLDNTALYGIQIETQSPDNKNDRYVVLLFNAEWVNDDYRILSIALINEKIDEITDQNLTD